MKIIVIVALLLTLSVLRPIVSGEEKDPWVGIWTLKQSDPNGAAARQTLRIEALAEGAHRHIMEIVTSQGQRIRTERTTTYDGRDVAVTRTPEVSGVTVTESFRRPEIRSMERVAKRDGQVTSTTRLSLSDDGRTFTLVVTGVRQGQTTMETQTFERQ